MVCTNSARTSPWFLFKHNDTLHFLQSLQTHLLRCPHSPEGPHSPPVHARVQCLVISSQRPPPQPHHRSAFHWHGQERACGAPGARSHAPLPPRQSLEQRRCSSSSPNRPLKTEMMPISPRRASFTSSSHKPRPKTTSRASRSNLIAVRKRWQEHSDIIADAAANA
jgi:hypothetical protein